MAGNADYQSLASLLRAAGIQNSKLSMFGGGLATNSLLASAGTLALPGYRTRPQWNDRFEHWQRPA
jgi:hypothetical protein